MSLFRRTPPFYRRWPCRLSRKIVDHRLLVSHESKYFYAQVQKAASSTVAASLYVAERGADGLDQDAVWRFKNEVLAKPSELDAAAVEELGRDYFRFAFVRNPYSRVYSCYLDKVMPVEAAQYAKRRMVARALGKETTDPISFTEFLDYLEHEGGLDTNAHWARQADLIVLPAREFDFIGKVESLGDDLATVLQRIYGGDRTVADWRPHATSAKSRLEELDDSQRKRIARLYAVDFDTFGSAT